VKKLKPGPTKTDSSRGNNETSPAILDVEEFVQGSQVNLKTAREFSKKSWKIYSQLVPDDARQVSSDLYEVSDRLLEKAKTGLAERSAYLKRNKKVDVFAAAMCRAAWEIGTASEEPDDNWENWNWFYGQPIWGANHPISEAWAGLGSMKVPSDIEGSLEFDSDTREWVDGPPRLGAEIEEISAENEDASNKTGGIFTSPAPPPPDYTGPRVIRISCSFRKEKIFLPGLTVKLEGAPICQLMKAFHSQARTPTVRTDAENLWESISRWVARSSGIKRAKPGRPAMYQGEEAAFLHDPVKGDSWAKVARKLCRLPHQHDHKCAENFRQQAKQYWKSLEKKCRLAK
jgi:hypothetical protein